MAQKDNLSQPDERSVLEVRREKLQQLIERGVDPYPAKTRRSHEIAAVLRDFPKLLKNGQKIWVAGRVMTLRAHGKITFATLRDGNGDIQIAFFSDDLGAKRYGELKGIDIGDFIEVRGPAFLTKKKERSIKAADYRLLAKSLRPLPEKWHGLQDPEERYRKRYLDMLANKEVREKLVVRSKLVRGIRDFMHEQGFIEIENPVLELTASGAAAKPFKTHINAYNLDLYLRICIGELWQKRSLVGGFEKVFELGRAFRNEGVDYSHNPDFTMLEYYWAFADYEDNIKLHEKLIPAVVKEATGKLKLEYEGKKIDFKAPYPRKTFRQAIKETSGIDIEKEDTRGKLRKAMQAKGYKIEKRESYRELLDGLFKDSFRMQQVQPIFITEIPVALSPLSKRNPDNPKVTDRFQLVVATFELSNSYSELNDPVDQRKRFEEQAVFAEEGDEEAMLIDEDFIEALEYGMPPATGTGIGIDRFAALLTNSHSVREITAYPLMKPK